MLTATTSILRKVQEDGGTVTFMTPVDTEGDRITLVILDRDVWVELGEPDEITVTTQPGDRLNEE